ncbi:hypothetical protein O6H91_03G063400 [Diphasiastrum complanatum]|uniref:Uncharacterized protein n=1 Tax=Diphasiastrum complanatum TaxID=34168 RepID=A0ACC2E723_DIPCM|nr:hypothetical protein O6H91_03G063400 [Diphasiastrum complanatum]
MVAKMTKTMIASPLLKCMLLGALIASTCDARHLPRESSIIAEKNLKTPYEPLKLPRGMHVEDSDIVTEFDSDFDEQCQNERLVCSQDQPNRRLEDVDYIYEARP